ncbi:hypothetical protein T492DRAFT_271888 [Pavlovales sp. CCMP2436]|nr:hypothetical protein T492DRAFT_271888 [Pavlovales sp. CCMP2436]
MWRSCGVCYRSSMLPDLARSVAARTLLGASIGQVLLICLWSRLLPIGSPTFSGLRRLNSSWMCCGRLRAVRRQLDQPTPGAKPPVKFSSFSNKDGYTGAVPSGNYLASVCKDYSESIGPYLDKEVKKRGAEMTGLNALLEYICKLCMGSSCPGKWRNCCID